jgi:hypothetical protein
VVFPAACFTLSEKDLEQFFKCILGVKVFHGYSRNIGRYLDEAKKRVSGMTSHDCHVLMTQILPVAIRGIMDEHAVRCYLASATSSMSSRGNQSA